MLIDGAKEVILNATGVEKALTIKALFADDSIDPMLPCSILKIFRDVTVVVDEALKKLI